jgi:succinyl-diaminopimelate desuccinylase
MTTETPDAGLTTHLARAAERDREPIVDLCRRLVAAPSVNPPGDTWAVAEVVRAQLAADGAVPELVTADPTMPSVLASLDSGRPGSHLVLNVHLDTMPAGDEALWSVPVRELTRRDGRLYGLGMGNMKGAVAAMTFAFRYLAELRDHWSGRITFCAVSDEVVFGEHGAAHLLRIRPDLYGDALLCGEGPGFGRLALGEKGVLWLAMEAVADGGHSSAVRPGASAAARLASAVVAVDALTGRRGALPEELAELAGYALPEELSLTANVGTVTAGAFIGQIATTGRAEVDLRFPPGISLAEAETLVAGAVEGCAVTVSRIKGWPANWTGPQEALTRAFQYAHQGLTGSPADYAVRLPASDASRWRAHAVPALCFGPQPTLSAGIDDHAEEDDVVRCAALYALTALGHCRRA